jgi:hypothetical protein
VKITKITALSFRLFVASASLVGCDLLQADGGLEDAGQGGASSGSGGAGGAIDPGCMTDDDCTGDIGGEACDPASGACVPCVVDTHCAPGSICADRACVPGCTDQQPCAVGFSCCGGFCHDLQNEDDHCGECDVKCSDSASTDMACQAGSCSITTCSPYFFDCNLDPSDGCEESGLTTPCVCTPGAMENCYTGIDGTMGIGPCKGGFRVCDASGLQWGACENQVLPKTEECNNGVDDDCNGASDDISDIDGDGFTICDGDCRETPFSDPFFAWIKPYDINPGAIEILDNTADDDCNPATPDDADPWTPCSDMPKNTNVTAMDLVRAMDLCQLAPEVPVPLQANWGVIDAEFRLADGTIPSAVEIDRFMNEQTAVLSSYGASILPKRGTTMAGFSTGRMRDLQHDGDLGSTSFGSAVNPPAVYLANHGGELPHPVGCAPTTMALDSVSLRVRMRMPTNGNALEYRYVLATAEPAQYVCLPRDDFALGLLTPRFPNWGLYFYDDNILRRYFSLISSVNSGRFDICVPYAPDTCYLGPDMLMGTSMQRMTVFDKEATPVLRGETITLDLMIFDGGDATVDSVMLLDDLEFVHRYCDWPGEGAACPHP